MCLPALKEAQSKVKAKASTPTASTPAPAPSPTPAPNYARRVTEALDQQKAQFEKSSKKQARREARLVKQMEENNNFMRAMHLSMTSPAAASGVRPIWTTQEVNPFAGLESNTESEEEPVPDTTTEPAEAEGNEENHDNEDRLDQAVDDNNSNDDVTSYLANQSSSNIVIPHIYDTCHPEHIIGTCRKSSLLASPSTMIVDSGATAHMDNDASNFEYILPVTTASGDPVYVQQGDGTDLLVTGMGPVSKVIQGKHIIRYMSYLIPSLSCPLYSVKQHMDSAGCYFHAEGGKANLAFPTRIINLDTNPEIQFSTCSPKSHSPNSSVTSFDYETVPSSANHGSFKAKVVKTKYYQESMPI